MTTQELQDRLNVLESKIDFIMHKLGGKPCYYCGCDTFNIKKLTFVHYGVYRNDYKEHDMTVVICDSCYSSYQNGDITIDQKPYKN